MAAAFGLLLAAAPAAGQTVVRGRVISPDTLPRPEMRAFVRWRAAGDTLPRLDSAAVDSTGRFAVPIGAAGRDSIDLAVDAADVAARTHHPALVRFRADSARREQVIILVPRRWRIPTGSYAGQEVEISPVRARTAVCRGCGAFWLHVYGVSGPVWFQSWRSSSFPLRIAFDREYSMPRGAAPDSSTFWRITQSVEEVFGQDLFRPARYADVQPEDDDRDPNDVVLVMVDPAVRAAALTTVLSRGGVVEYGTMRLQRAGPLTNGPGWHLVGHELLHALGAGHTCEWRSVAADAMRCPELRADQPTAHDVAYIQVLYRVGDLQRATGARWGLDAALEGERALGRRREW
ncbi:MAG TPA: hypothetical protein VEY93_03655 [Longimicrobium sp.]|nr:hypothetical protein [Longimicrobium sp.]